MLFASLIMMLLAKARNDVMFAHYAIRRNIIHAVNITAAGNIICPQGQTSFSVIHNYSCAFQTDSKLKNARIRRRDALGRL